MRQETAEAVALQALGWLLTQEELLPQFLNATGAAPGDLRQLAAQPEFLGAVLDFLLGADALVLAFAEAAEIGPELPMQARAALPGGAVPDWT